MIDLVSSAAVWRVPGFKVFTFSKFTFVLVKNLLNWRKNIFQKWLEQISCPYSLGSNPISLVFGKNVAYNISDNWYFFQSW
jgi:hypothetical protein